MLGRHLLKVLLFYADLWRMPRPLSVCFIAAMVLLSGCQREISGKYIGKFTNGVWWLQLVRTPDNHLTGQLETSVLNADGRIERQTVSITGAVNGANVTISAKQLGFDVLTLSGTLDGNKLTLTGGQPSPMVLTRSDLSDYQRQINTVNTQAQQVLAAQQAAAARQENERILNDFIAMVDQLVNKMQNFTSEADVHLGSFPGAEDRYRAITAKMTEYVNRERQLSGDPSAGVARGQLDLAANQASIDTDQLHNSAQSLRASFESNIQPLTGEAANFEAACRQPVLPGLLTPAQSAARNAACERLFRADVPYRQKFEAMTQGLMRLEQTYQQERKAQEGLLQMATRLQ